MTERESTALICESSGSSRNLFSVIFNAATSSSGCSEVDGASFFSGSSGGSSSSSPQRFISGFAGGGGALVTESAEEVSTGGVVVAVEAAVSVSAMSVGKRRSLDRWVKA